MSCKRSRVESTSKFYGANCDRAMLISASLKLTGRKHSYMFSLITSTQAEMTVKFGLNFKHAYTLYFINAGNIQVKYYDDTSSSMQINHVTD